MSELFFTIYGHAIFDVQMGLTLGYGLHSIREIMLRNNISLDD